MVYNKGAREKGGTSLEQAHYVLLEMMKVIDAICRKHGIQYWLTGGTLLGAIRHNGFIPWDDDFDINMTRKEYERFINIAPKELPEGLFFQYKNTDSKNCKWIRIRDNYSTVIGVHEKGKKVNYHQGIFIDVTPYDLVEKDFRWAKMFLNRKFQFCRNPFVKKARWFFNQCATLPVKLIGADALKRYFLKKYSGPNVKYVSTGIEISNFFYDYDPEVIFPIREIDFLGERFMAPNNIHLYLTVMFGDYMNLPPKVDQVPRHTYKMLPFTKCNHPRAQDY